MVNTVTNPGARLAGLLADLCQKLKKGSHSEDELALFLKRQNPFGIEATMAAPQQHVEEYKTLTVPADLPLATRIALGKYNWVNENVTEDNFHSHNPTSVGEWEWKLFHSGRNISSEAVVEAVSILADGWTPATLEHLLAFGEKYPDEQRKYPIVALGSSCTVIGGRNVPWLWCGDAKRYLGLGSWRGGWSGGYRFLVVRKKV